MADMGNVATAATGELNTAAKRYCLSQGWAMPPDPGSYPIRPANMHGATDVTAAVHAVGRGNASGGAIRKHIMRRATAIGMTDSIPDTWNADGSLSDATSGTRGIDDSVLMSLDDGRSHYRAGIADLDLKPGGDGRTIHGIAVPFNKPQRINDHLVEAFDPHAFDHQLRSLYRTGYYNQHSVHDGVEVGHIKEHEVTPAGLYTESYVRRGEDGDRTLDEIRSGLLPHQSIGFEAGPGGSVLRDGVTYRTKARLFELAAVPVGAYGAAASIAGVRSSDPCPCCGQMHGTRSLSEDENWLAQARLMDARMLAARSLLGQA
jgi:phage head maturation protease